MRAVVTERDIPASGDLRIEFGSIVTPSARDLARERGVKLIELPKGESIEVTAPGRIVAIGADHGGYRMKQALRTVFEEFRLTVKDVGVHDENSADYPDIALAVSEMVVQGKASRGVIIDGAGIGSAIAANKVPGIRAALCYDKTSAKNSREHNDSNVLTLGGRLLTLSQAEEVLRTWLATSFAGGRHAGRLQKITDIEKRFATWTPSSSNNS